MFNYRYRTALYRKWVNCNWSDQIFCHSGNFWDASRKETRLVRLQAYTVHINRANLVHSRCSVAVENKTVAVSARVKWVTRLWGRLEHIEGRPSIPTKWILALCTAIAVFWFCQSSFANGFALNTFANPSQRSIDYWFVYTVTNNLIYN